MKLYYPINVDLYNVYPLKKMDAQQGNIGRGVLVTLTAAGQVIELEGEMVALWAKKPDGTVSYLPCQVVDGKIKADFTDQMLAVTGSVSVELQMINGDDNITTPIFKVEVHRSNIDSSAVESQNEFTALQKAVNSVNTALEDVEELKKTGLKGDKGDQGEAATIQVGSVSAGEPGAAPEVNNSGTASAAVFDFVLPRGGQGPPGKDGEKQVFFGAYADFPEEGDSAMLYVDTSNTDMLLLYRWNGSLYVPSGDGDTDKYALKSIYGDHGISLSGTRNGMYSIALNGGTARGQGSIAAGMGSEANGTNSFAFGNRVIARGEYSHAEGSGSSSQGSVNFAFGQNLEANSLHSQFVCGTRNVSDRNAYFIVGTGSSTNTNGLAVYSGFCQSVDFRCTGSPYSETIVASLLATPQKIASGSLSGTSESVILTLDDESSLYVLFSVEITDSNGNIYGYRAQLLARPGINATSKAPQGVDLGKSTNSGITIVKNGDGVKLTGTNGKTAYYSLYKF